MVFGVGDLPETGVVIPETEGVASDDMVAFAADAERAGFGSIWCSEGWGYSPFSLLARVSEVTDCPLGTGIANAFARSPSAVAMEALTLHEATDGRFVLGLGTSTPSIVEGFHGTDFDRPVRRLRETVELVKLALSGDGVEYDGVAFEPSGYALDHVDGPVEVPVVTAALGPTNVAMSVDYADGIMTYLLPFDHIPAALDAGAERAGRPADVDVIAQLPVCVSADVDRARRTFARHLAYYVGGVDAYNDVVARHGFPDAAERIRDAWTAGDRARARAAVPDALMDAVGIVAPPDDFRNRLDAVLEGPVDTALVSFPSGVDEGMRRETLRAMAR